MPAALCESMKSVSDSLSRWAENRRRWLAIGAIILAALLPLPLLGRSLGIDEAASVWFARFHLPDLLIRLCDPHPPGYYLILKGWITLGKVEAWLRLPSLLAGVLAVALTYGLGRRLLGPLAGAVAALLLATFPLQTWYTAEARMYALTQMLGVAMVWAIWRVMDDGGRKIEEDRTTPSIAHGLSHGSPVTFRALCLSLFLAWAVGVVTLMVDISALLPFALLQLIWLAHGRPAPRRWLLLQTAILAPTVLYGLASPIGNALGQGYQAVFLATLANRIGISLDPTGARTALVAVAVVAAASAAALALAWQRWGHRGSAPAWIVPATVVTWMLFLLIAAIPRLFTVKRLLVPLFPYAALAAGWALARSRVQVWGFMVVVGLMLALLVTPGHTREPWREVAARLTGPGTVVWVDELDAPAFDYYARQATEAGETAPVWAPLYGRAFPTLPTLEPPKGGSLWVLTADSPYRDLHALLPAAFRREYALVETAQEAGISVRRFIRRLEPVTGTLNLPEPGAVTWWGLMLPSPLDRCGYP